MIKQITPNMVINSFVEHYLKFLTESDMFKYRLTVTTDMFVSNIELSGSSFFNGLLKEAPVVMAINSGDCGVAAIAIGWVLSHFNTEATIHYYDNGEHAYLSVNEVLYDTIYRFGVKSHSLMLGAKPEKEIKPLTLDEICKAFIIADIQGQEMISSFCELWNVPGISFTEYNTDLEVEDIANEIIFTQNRMAKAIKEL